MAQLQVVVLARLFISITRVIHVSMVFLVSPITKANPLRSQTICRWVMIRLKSIGKFIVKRLLPTFACAWVFFVIPPVSLQGQYVFEFHTGSALGSAGTALVGQTGSVNYTQNGITLTAEAFRDGTSSGNKFNGSNASAFGVTKYAAGDNTTRIDNLAGNESIQFSFNLAGTFDGIDLHYIEESSNEGTLHFAGSGSTVQLNTSNSDHGSYDNFVFSSPYSFSANEVITLGMHSSADSGENYSLQSFTITPKGTYWDTDSGNSGASTGTTASGNWSGSNWNFNSDGSGSNGNWDNSQANVATFSAGTDATGSSAIVADLASVVLSGITVEEGGIAINAGAGDLSLDGTAAFNVGTSSSLTVNEALVFGSGDTLNKTGDGILTIGESNSYTAGTTTISKGLLQVASSKTLSGGVTGTGSDKSILGGDGTISGTTTIGSGTGEVDVISPGDGYATSLSSASSQKQAPSGRTTSAEAIGSLTTNTLNWNSGGVYDWEISDFDPSNNNGYDVLNITNLTFDNSNNYDINILPVNSSGGAGVMSNYANTGNNYTTTNGFLFLDAGSVTNSPGTGDVSSFFDIRADDFAYQVNSWYGDWGVHHDGSGNFYLTYSVVPEPSTYAMVFGLFGIIFLNPRSRTSLLGFLSRIRGQNQFRKQHIRNALPYS